MLSFIYRFLVRSRKDDDVSREMLDTFEQARADAREHGRWSYLRFAIREAGGVLSFAAFFAPGRLLLRSRIALIVGGGLLGLLLAAAAPQFLPIPYTSEAALMIEPPAVPASLLANDGANADAVNLDLLLDQVRSRSVLTAIIHEQNLYPNLRARRPLMEVIDQMRKGIRLEKVSGLTIRVAFTYSDSPSGKRDRILAQRTAEDLVSRVIDYSKSAQWNRDYQTVQYLQWRSGHALDSWKQLNAKIRAVPAEDTQSGALALDRTLAQKEYEDAHQKLTEAESIQELDQRGIGRSISLLDPPSLPVDPDIPESEVDLFGLGCGLLVGFLASYRSGVISRRNVPIPLGNA
jgi:uncharacterized protein involved in exopolysaccharide biosynthesis